MTDSTPHIVWCLTCYRWLRTWRGFGPPSYAVGIEHTMAYFKWCDGVAEWCPHEFA